MKNEWLEEKPFLDNSKQKNCCWRIKEVDSQYPDTIGGVAAIALGVTLDDELSWHYILEAPVKGKVRSIVFYDGLYILDKDSLIKRPKTSKFGFTVDDIAPYARKMPKYPFTIGRSIQL